MNTGQPKYGFEPSVLRWARKQTSMSIDALSNRLAPHIAEITPEVIASWEAGTTEPNPAQIKHLSEIYKRPIAVFFLAEPPKENPLPPDRRTVGSRRGEPFSPEALLAIRRARRIQELALELEEDLEEPRAFKYPRYAASDPDKLAAQIRADLSVSLTDQFHFRTYADFFQYLRKRIESAGVITLRMGGHQGFDIEDARALSFTDEQPYVILINNKDTEGAKNFSLLHEFGHLLLRAPGICNDFNAFAGNSHVDPIEVFCNQFAASFLVPADALKAHPALRDKQRISLDELDAIVKRLAVAFKVSRFVILRRLLTIGLVLPAIYKRKAAEWAVEVRPRRQGGKNIPPKTALLNNGPTFSRLVFESYRQARISSAAAAEYLSLKSKYLPAIERLLQPHAD